VNIFTRNKICFFWHIDKKKELKMTYTCSPAGNIQWIQGDLQAHDAVSYHWKRSPAK
jgi:hypothetical protein